jgi:hypothetical protein
MKENLEAGRHDGSLQLIHIQAGRTWYTILQVVNARQIDSSGIIKLQHCLFKSSNI